MSTRRSDGRRAGMPTLGASASAGAGVVRVRAFRPQDVPLILEAADDPMIPLVTTVPPVADPRTARAYLSRQARRYARGEGYSFAIADRDDHARGQIGLWPRRDDRGRAGIGYWLAPSARGRGFASAAVRLVVDWAWTLGTIERLELFIEPSNTASIAVAESTGFAREGLLRSWMPVGGTRRDMLVYACVRGRDGNEPARLSGPATPPRS
ncbi:GNAT family N-acetyltransferase [Agromyces sp. NPDC058126]|uniref:GNAT family N-acetyltransferase n=1 Tax=Agromyces sp. NPDC058126 TaxID=3346350 RepID=UPI0036DF58FA